MASADFGNCVFILQIKNSWKYLSGFPQNYILGSRVRKSGCRLENCCADICAVCDSPPNHICLTLYDVINYNDVTAALSSYEYERNITFTGV